MYLEDQNFQKHFFNKSWSSSQIFFIEFLTQKNDFEGKNFEMFEEVVHNFGKSNNDRI